MWSDQKTNRPMWSEVSLFVTRIFFSLSKVDSMNHQKAKNELGNFFAAVPGQFPTEFMNMKFRLIIV